MKKNSILISLIGLVAFACGTADEASNQSEARSTKADYAEKEDGEGEELVYSTEEVAYDEPTSQIEHNTESYAYIKENDFKNPLREPLSTFSIDVDNASYTNVRRMLEVGSKPPVDAVRIEEFINYFDYNYPTPTDQKPFSVYTELAECPWDEDKQLLHIGLQGQKMSIDELPPSNLVFLVDVSGSMDQANKLPLLKKSLIKMVNQMNGRDKISLVVYAGNSGVVLDGASCDNPFLITTKLNGLRPGGSTGGAEGIELAYQIAEKHFITNGINRIILATDGDFNVGPSSDAEMQRLIESKRDLGIYITALGFGMGNYKDSKMEAIADHGNGNYFYIDDMRSSNHILVNNLAGTLMTIAKDVKIQVEFNPEMVASYRLIGYENRLMNEEDFDNDKKDAGEIGAGHTVTAIYEIIRGKATNDRNLKYQANTSSADNGELAHIKLRYKLPNESTSQLIAYKVNSEALPLSQTSDDFRFSAAVSAFGMTLRESAHIEGFSLNQILELADGSSNADPNNLRRDFMTLVKTSRHIYSSKEM